MRNFILKVCISALTFTIGLGVFSLWLSQPSTDNRQNIVTINDPIEFNEKDSPEEFDPWKLPDDFRPLEKGEFFPVGHACGDGYVDGWLAYDGSRLSEGFSSISRKEFDSEVAEAGKVIEKVENYPNKDGIKGLRVVLQGRNEEKGKDYYSILWFGKWYKKDTGRYFINAPNLEIALELERKLIKDSQKNKQIK